MNCKNCKETCQKWGKQKNGIQRYYCRYCKKCQQDEYMYTACKSNINKQISVLVCVGVGVRGIAFALQVSVNTVIKKIKMIAKAIVKPVIPLNRKVFELDELRTYIDNKSNQYWVAYALSSESKEVIDFVVGKRSKRILKVIVDNLLLSNVSIIKTDRLNIYRSLIPASRHISNAYNINHIERNNLNLRTHLKRLSRRTICFSRSKEMLEACLKIYFWNKVM